MSYFIISFLEERDQAETSIWRWRGVRGGVSSTPSEPHRHLYNILSAQPESWCILPGNVHRGT